jgi:hypothetical protein
MQIRKRISLTIVNASNELVDFDNIEKWSFNMIINSIEIKYIIKKFIISIAKLKRRIVTRSICNSCIDKSLTLSQKTSLTKCTFQLIFSWFMFTEFRTRCIKIFFTASFLFKLCRSKIARNLIFVVVCIIKSLIRIKNDFNCHKDWLIIDITFFELRWNVTLRFVFANNVFNTHAHKDDDCIEKKIEELSCEFLNDKLHVCLESKNLNESDRDDENVESIFKKIQIELFWS